jgi:hypothetical protein
MFCDLDSEVQLFEQPGQAELGAPSGSGSPPLILSLSACVYCASWNTCAGIGAGPLFRGGNGRAALCFLLNNVDVLDIRRKPSIDQDPPHSPSAIPVSISLMAFPLQDMTQPYK